MLGARERHPARAWNLCAQALIPDTTMCWGTELVQKQKSVNEAGSAGGYTREEACKAMGKERGCRGEQGPDGQPEGDGEEEEDPRV